MVGKGVFKGFKICTLFLVFSICILCSSLVFAAKTVNYADVEEAILNLQISSSFELVKDGSNPSVTSTDVKLDLYPLTDYRQELISLETDATQEKGEFVFTYNKPRLGSYQFGYSAKMRLKTEFKPISKKILYPLSNDYEYRNEYTHSTEFMDFDKDKTIKQTAEDIIGNEDDLYVVVYKLSKWITDNMEYNLDSANTVEKASNTLKLRKGVCDEATILFIAFARSIGIPAKYVSGVAYTNLNGKNDWDPHAWAEVYFEGYGWIPFDFTYQQYGFVDASHIKLKESDNANESSIKYEWVGRDVTLVTSALSIQTSAIEIIGDKENPITISLSPIHKSVGSFSYNIFEAKVTNLKNNYYTANVYLSKSPTVIGKNNQVILLKPLEEKKIFWIVYVNDTVDEGHYYIYPIQSESSQVSSLVSNMTLTNKDMVYSYEEITSELFQLQKQADLLANQDIDFSCSNKNSFYDYEPTIVDCLVKNNGNKEQVLKLCFLNDCESFRLKKGEIKNKQFSILLKDVKKYSSKAVLENKEIYKVIPIEFEILKKPDLIVTIISKPETLSYDSFYAVEFRLDKESTLYNVDVNFNIGDYVESWHIDTFDVPRQYKISLKADNIYQGNNSLYIDALYFDANKIKYETHYVDTIEIEKMKFFQKLKYYLVKFLARVREIAG
ncbi:MAG: transglutaminase-like domain-containing protein [Candidatus Woesearchaeota archaeon]|jgi:hypothetical protein